MEGKKMEEEVCSYMEMLRSGDEEDLLALPSQFLRFGSGCYGDDPLFDPLMFHGGVVAPQVSSDSSSMSSLSSSPPTSTTTTVISCSKSTKKKQENSGGRKADTNVSSKKAKTGGSAPHGTTIKVRKEKLGERIMALQQLVSPFGKSDTASVLHEALGYIRFLHDQVQVLSSPYLQRLPSSDQLHEGQRTSDLRSRGLCLVPVSCTEHVAGTNGADLWSPSVGKNNFSSPFSKH